MNRHWKNTGLRPCLTWITKNVIFRNRKPTKQVNISNISFGENSLVVASIFVNVWLPLNIGTEISERYSEHDANFATLHFTNTFCNTKSLLDRLKGIMIRKNIYIHISNNSYNDKTITRWITEPTLSSFSLAHPPTSKSAISTPQHRRY